MKKTIKTILLSLLVTALCGSVCFAENTKFTGTCTYDGSKINSDFTSSSFAASIRNLEPGDSVDYTITYKNGASELTRWYMKNSVIKTLEDSSTASNGGYSYTLTNVGPDGKRTVLYDSEEVGGEDTHGGTGLEQATNGTDDWFFIQELASGETGKTLLDVTLDGETQVNSYQDTDGSLDWQEIRVLW